MLNALLHAPVGDVAAVVTRYYGGSKLARAGRCGYGGRAGGAGGAALPRTHRVTWR